MTQLLAPGTGRVVLPPGSLLPEENEWLYPVEAMEGKSDSFIEDIPS